MTKHSWVTIVHIVGIFCLWLLLPGRSLAQKRPGGDTSLVKYGFGSKLYTSGVSCFIDSGLNANASGSNDSSLNTDFPWIRQQPFNVPYPTFIRQINYNAIGFVFWEKLDLANTTDSLLELFIYAGDLDFFDCYLVSAGYPLLLVEGGNLRRPPPGSNMVNQQSLTIPLYLKPRQKGQLYIKIRQRTDEYVFDGLEIYDKDSLNASYLSDLEGRNLFVILELLFQGFLLCQLFYVISQWLILRRKEYLYYFCYLAVLAIYFLSKQEGLFGVTLFFTRYPLMKVYLGKTLLILPYFLYFRFIRSFLEMPENYPALNKWIVRLEYFLVAYLFFDMGLILLTFNRTLQTQLYTVVLILVFLLTLFCIIYMLRRKQPLVNYVVTGSLFVATGHILGLVFSYLIFERHMDLGINNVLGFSQAGIILEIVCFTAGLSFKSHAAEKEKIKSQEKLIEQLKANELLQTRMQHIRNKIAQDLHDDIGSTLSSISILSELALKEKDRAETLIAIAGIKDNSLLLMERMDDIVWSINPRNDSLQNLLIRISHFATTLFEAKEIDYTIEIQENIHLVKLPVDYRQHVYLILKEAINNLVKYSSATLATIRVNFDHEVLTLLILDNGNGFDPSLQHSGNGIAGMQMRAEQMQAVCAVESVPGEGTCVSLKVTLQ